MIVAGLDCIVDGIAAAEAPRNCHEGLFVTVPPPYRSRRCDPFGRPLSVAICYGLQQIVSFGFIGRQVKIYSAQSREHRKATGSTLRSVQASSIERSRNSLECMNTSLFVCIYERDVVLLCLSYDLVATIATIIINY